MKIKNRIIGRNMAPFIIAELSGNHNQSLERALAIVEAGAAAGVHAIKLQTYTADSMTLDCHGEGFDITDPKNLWTGQTLHGVYQQANTPWEWHEPIFKHCEKFGLICFSTPFDLVAVDLLESLDAPAYKIASFENADLPLLRRVAKTGKPVIMSTGMATLAELDESVRTLRENGCAELALLKCTSTYPASPENSNLLTLPHLRALFNCEVGVSDHTMGIGVGVASIGLGATLIEKHFTLRRADGGVDSAFSMEPQEMASLVYETEAAQLALGKIVYGCSCEQEQKSRGFRRSLYIARDLAEGEVLTEENLRIIRPGYGLPPKYYEVCLGRRVNRALVKGTPLNWDMMG